MTDLWTWGGEYIGRRERDDLWTHNGNHIGRFHGDEVYGLDGRYLGEIMSQNRLITNQSKKHLNRGHYSAHMSRVGWVPSVGYVGIVMYVGYEDFPALERLES